MEELRRLEARDSVWGIGGLDDFDPVEVNIVRAVLGYFDPEDADCMQVLEQIPDIEREIRAVWQMPGAVTAVVTVVCSHHGRKNGTTRRVKTLGTRVYVAALPGDPEAMTRRLTTSQALALLVNVATNVSDPGVVLRDRSMEAIDNLEEDVRAGRISRAEVEALRRLALSIPVKGGSRWSQRNHGLHQAKADEKRARPASPDEAAAVLESLYTMKAYCSSCKRTELLTRERLARLIRAKLAKGHHLTNEDHALRLDISRLQDVNRSR